VSKGKPPRRSKYVNKTPITIAVPKQHLDMIASVPRASFKRFKEGIADIDDWFNLSFRIKVGHYLAEKIYEQEAVDAFNIAFDHCKEIGERWLTNAVVTATEEELSDVEAGLDAVDEMHGENIRRHLLDAYYAARTELSGKSTTGFKS